MAQQPELGDRIREARASKGWKQRELASEVEVEPITVSRWERGATTPDLDVLRLVADATGKPLSYFVADAYDAMTSDRAYRGRLTPRAAVEELERCAGTQFDPAIVATFAHELVHRAPATAVAAS